jgi:hypothetical protein
MSNREDLKKILMYLMLLVLISCFRNISPFFLNSALREHLVYFMYLSMILYWAHSIQTRFTQKSMRIYLLSEAAVAAGWMTVRFIQNAFLSENIAALRYSGYFIFVPVVLVPLLGFYASFGLGHGDDYHLSRKWYLLIIPAAALLVLALNDEQNHFLFQVFPEEAQPNLYFHPYIGLYIVISWSLLLICARTLLICQRNHVDSHATVRQWIAPFSEPILLLAFSTPYMLSSFWVKWEPVEFSAGALFIEALSWEIYIGIGLIPVNTQYEKVFNLSTIKMQILNQDGTVLVRSQQAPELSQDTLKQLQKKSVIETPNGQELQMFHMNDHDLVWMRDVFHLHTAIHELQQNTEELKQESDLLAMELEFRAEEAAAKEKNDVYNQLSTEVSQQLSMMTELISQIGQTDQDALIFQKICFIATYVKRRCNLRLIELLEDDVCQDDLIISIQDLIKCMKDLGIEIVYDEKALPAVSQYGIQVLDLLEAIMEQEQFQPKRIELHHKEDDCLFVLTDHLSSYIEECIPGMFKEMIPGGYCIHMRKEITDEKS